MWIGNKPSEWLDKLPEEESAAYHEQARKMAKEIKEKAKKRTKEDKRVATRTKRKMGGREIAKGRRV